MTRPLRVFLCHASQDKPSVWKLHRYLKLHGVQPWLDQADLLPGEDWEVEIPKALYASDVILVCLSKNSVNKEGYVQKEIAFALDKALEKPEGTIFIIPVKLEDCELPKRLSRYQAVDLFRTDGRKRLLMGLNKRVNDLGGEVVPLKIDDIKQRTPKPIKAEIEQERNLTSISHGENKIEEKKEVAKPFTRVLNPALLNSQKLKQIKEDKQSNIFPRIFLGAVIFLGLLTIFMAGNLIFENFLLAQTSTPTTPSVTPKPLTLTMTATKSPAISTTTRLDIGSTTLGNDGMLLMYIPAGEFTMGSNNSEPDEHPAHQVNLDAYWIDQTEVTNEMYAKCVQATRCPSLYTTRFYNPIYIDHPVVDITWYVANSYCLWAERRLPTEAEWEKAARGTDGRIYPWGDETPISDFLNFNSNDSMKVGSYHNGQSVYGVFDIAGNVWEWVADWYDSSYYSISPKSNPMQNQRVYLPSGDGGWVKVIRGGSWQSNRTDLSGIPSSDRGKKNPDGSNYLIGFRCAMDADQ
ncbi:MAG: SUMF1/EgtB/PvdO family nonheme iron enzyme [Anaerolineales bacterium]|nr:MAG: SUMF1/EgtB/PvdO family nonheme iron enzyme [Anaerolineales bacterium]